MAPDTIDELHRAAQAALRRSAYRDAHAHCLGILEQDPHFADAFFLLGMIALAHGQVGKGMQLVDRALDAGGENPEYLAQKARCLVLLKDDAAALDAAGRALELEPDSALTLDTIGVALSKAGDHDTAITAFERAVEKSPDNPQFFFNLAASQEFSGRFDDAAASYRRAIGLKPDFYRAHWALSGLLRADEERNHIARLEALLAQSDLDADATLYLCHALAKEYEDLGHYARAFDYLRQGKRRKLQSLGSPESGVRDIFAAIHRVCSPEFLAAPARGHDSDEPIFVVGMPRTGTTLVERILSTHGEVFGAGELSEFGLCFKRAAGTTTRSVLDAQTVRRGSAIDFAALGESYVRSTRPRTGHTPHFVDKMPPNFLYAGFIHRALPKAKCVCLRRDPMDTCLSNYRQLFSLHSGYYHYAYDLLETGRYYILFDRLVRYWEEQLGDSFLVIRYEDLVDDTEAQARRLLEFCGLRWDPAVLEFHRNEAAVATPSARQVREPVYSTSIGRWRRYRTELEPLRELLEAEGIDCC